MSAQIDKEELTRDTLVGILRRRWWLVVLCAAVGAAAAGLVSGMQQKQYRASAQLLFRNDTAPDESLQSVFGLPTSATAPDPTQQAATDVALVSLATVADMTAKAIGHHLTGSEVGSEVTVTAVGQSNLASITATSASPTLAARLANTFAKQYIVFRRHADRLVITQALRGVQARLNTLSPQLRGTPTGQQLENQELKLSALAGLQTGDAEVVQTAAVPSAPALPKTKLNVAAGGLLGLILGIALAMVFYMLDGRAKSPEELAELYGLPILGAVPRTGELRDEARGVGENGRTVLSAPAADAFRAVRARLRYFNLDRDLSSVLVTSATRGEGKSTIAWHLASVIAMTGRKVLLVETDLRQPVFARVHGLRAAPGIAEVVMRGVPVETAIQHVGESAADAPIYDKREVAAARTHGGQALWHRPSAREYATGDPAGGNDQDTVEWDEALDGWADGTMLIDYAELDPDALSNGDVDRDGETDSDQDASVDPAGAGRPRMDVLVAGAPLSNPSDLLERNATSELLQDLVDRYDFVILDAPPGAVVSDTFPLINQVSGVIIVSSMSHASKDAAKQLRSQLERVNAPTLGVVVNNVRRSHLHTPAFGQTAAIPPEPTIAKPWTDHDSRRSNGSVVDPANQPVPPERRRWTPRLVVPVFLTLIAIVIAGLVLFLVSHADVVKAARAASATPSASAGRQSIAAHSAAAGHRQHTGALAASPAPVHLELVATAPVWVCLQDRDGRVLIDGRTIEPGETTGSFVSPAFKVFLGNTGVQLGINGQLHSLASSPDRLAYSVTQRGVTALPTGVAVPCA